MPDDQPRYTDADVDRIVNKRLEEQAERWRLDSLQSAFTSLELGQEEIKVELREFATGSRNEVRRRASWERAVTKRLDDSNHLRELLVTKEAFQAFVDGLVPMLATQFLSREEMLDEARMLSRAREVAVKLGIPLNLTPLQAMALQHLTDHEAEDEQNRAAKQRVGLLLKARLRLDALRTNTKLILVPFFGGLGYALANSAIAFIRTPAVQHAIHFIGGKH